jgi:hypothetical protein
MNPHPQAGPSSMALCPFCQSANSSQQRYCGQCGNALNPTPTTINAIVEQQLQRELSLRLKDQKVVAVEIAESVYERVSKWAKIFVLLFTIPLGAALYFIYGQYTNLSGLIKNSETAAKQVLARATEEAEGAEILARNASQKTTDLNKRIDDRLHQFNMLDAKVNATLAKVTSYESRMQQYEARISKSGTSALAQVETLTKSSNTALSEISQLQSQVARQQKELTETGSLVKEFASRSMVEEFRVGATVPKDFAVITHEPRKHSVYMRLGKVPYPQTVRIQYEKTAQPLNSYSMVGNVVIFSWWDNIVLLSQQPLFVSYLADTSAPENKLFKALSVKDKRAFVDNRPLFYRGIPDSLPEWLQQDK